MHFSPWIYSDAIENCRIDDNSIILKYDGVDLKDIYPKLKKCSWNTKQKYTVVIVNAEIYFTTRIQEIMKVIKYIHMVNNVQVIMISTANFYRVKPVECWFYPTIIENTIDIIKQRSGLEHVLHQTFSFLGVNNNDISALTVYWQRYIDENNLSYHQLLNLKNFLSDSKRVIEQSQCTAHKIDLPVFQKYLICAIFIGCFMPEDNDKYLFVNDSKRRKSKRQKMSTDRLELGPLPCTINRVIALYKQIAGEDCNIQVQNVVQMLWELSNKGLIVIEDVYILCQYSFEFAKECEQAIGFRMSAYFDV